MIKSILIASLLMVIFRIPLPAQHSSAPNPGLCRETVLFDNNWKFSFGDAASAADDFGYGTGTLFAKAGEAVGAVSPDFNDSSWRSLDLPHDWAVELDFVNLQGEGTGIKDHGFKPTSRIFPKTSIGWYRKTFIIPETDEGKGLSFRFDGVFRDCNVWLNGHLISRNLSGYSEFSCDIADYVKYGKKNVVVVRVDASQYEGWFYEGAGIYRHVWLQKFNPVHIPLYGVFVHSKPGKNRTIVTVETEISNSLQSGTLCELESRILDAAGKIAGSALTKNIPVNDLETGKLLQEISVSSPNLWSIARPYLYKLISLVKVDGKLTDSISTEFGIRTVLFDKDNGFFLNGETVKIKGVCNHQDHAGLGSALPDRMQYYRIERLKDMGCNAYRSSHNPPTRELLEACDRLGMLVLDENRLMGSSAELKGQFETLIRRDRNHPSVIAWSLGNEEYIIQSNSTGKRIAESLMGSLRKLDPTRLCTYAGNNGNSYEGINTVVPIRGFNYMNISNIDKYRNEHPEQVLWGSEEASTLCTRGIYRNDSLQGYMNDYDQNIPGWGATAEQWWKFYNKRKWLMGAFVWTGFDYRGEPTPYSWPCINSHFGIMDVCGFPKNNFYYYQAWWSDKDVLHIYPHWNWQGREGDTLNVWCQSNCQEVELFLNGKSQGKKVMQKDSHLEWKLAYEPGILEAKGLKDGRILISRVETTGEAVRIVLTPDRSRVTADGRDVSVVNVTVQDEKGREVPTADELIEFEVSGSGKIIGVGNGDPGSHEPDKYLSGNYMRHLFNGKCQVIVQSLPKSGDIVLKAAGTRLKQSAVVIHAD